MKRNVLVFGLMSGLIITIMMVVTINYCVKHQDFEGNKVWGYTGMIAAFAFVFLGVKNYRDKYNNGIISFAKALKLGFLISLVGSTIYVGVWLIDYYVFIPDFMDRYTEHVLNASRKSGASAAELEKTTKEMASFKEWYKNPLFVILITYAEILPVGLIVSLITALLLKRKSKGNNV